MNNNQSNHIIFLVLLIFFIIIIVLFNFFIDPYFIFRNSSINGINNVKLHKFSNRRTAIYPDIKLNSKNKNIVFTGNCLLFQDNSDLKEAAFYTIPVVRMKEVFSIIKNINKIAPNIKTIYLGVFFDDFYNDNKEENTDKFSESDDIGINFQDIVNLLFSWNTTKYSIETIKASVENNGNEMIYVYPYREIADKKYDKPLSFNSLEVIKEIIDFSEKNNIKLIIYYSPIHVTKKIDLYEKGMWKSNQELKKKLAEITEFYDYSLFNEYNHSPIDENSLYFIDNVHLTYEYNDLVINDLLSNNQEIGIRINKNNVDKHIKEDEQKLEKYMKQNKEIVLKIKNITKEDTNIQIKRKITNYERYNKNSSSKL